MEWPYRRFKTAFDAFQRRRACEELERRRDLHVAAFHSNPNLDMEENNRPKRLAELERSYQNLIAHIWNGTSPNEPTEDEKALMDNDFMRASARNMFSLPGEAEIASLPN